MVWSFQTNIPGLSGRPITFSPSRHGDYQGLDVAEIIIEKSSSDIDQTLIHLVEMPTNQTRDSKEYLQKVERIAIRVSSANLSLLPTKVSMTGLFAIDPAKHLTLRTNHEIVEVTSSNWYTRQPTVQILSTTSKYHTFTDNITRCTTRSNEIICKYLSSCCHTVGTSLLFD